MFPENLKRLRLQFKLNKRQAAILLNLPYTTYNNYETGSREPNSEVLVKIANTFDVSTDYLLDNLPFEGNNVFLTEDEQAIIEKYRNLPVEVQKAVKHMIDSTYDFQKEKKDEKPAEETPQDSAAIESPAPLYHGASARNIMVAAYGDGMHVHTCPADKEDELVAAQKDLQVKLAIAKRREMYGK